MNKILKLLNYRRETVINQRQANQHALMNAQNTAHECRILINEADQDLIEIESSIEVLKGVRKN